MHQVILLKYFYDKMYVMLQLHVFT